MAFRVLMPCRACGAPAMRWCDAVGFVHIGCVPEEWFVDARERDRKGLPLERLLLPGEQQKRPEPQAAEPVRRTLGDVMPDLLPGRR